MGFFGKAAEIAAGVVLSPVVVPLAVATVAYEELTKIKCRECGCKYNEKDGYDDEYCSYSCYYDAKSRRERERERQREREIEREKEKNKQMIQFEIDDFKSLSKRQTKDKYGVKI